MKSAKTNIVSMLVFLTLVGIGVYLFIIDNERRHINLTDKNIHIVLSENDWTSKNYELTIKYDGLASKHIKGYSFDGGKSWSNSNIYYVEKTGTVQIKRNTKKTTMTLITCTKNNDKLQTVYILELYAIDGESYG